MPDTRGALVVHGLTGTPATVTCLSEALTRHGFQVTAPILAGHGGTVEELSQSTWHDWYQTVRIAYAELSRRVKTIYYAGVSLGALLGLQLALDEGDGIRALALMSTPMRLSFWNEIGVALARHTPLRYMVRSIEKRAHQSVADPVGQRLYMQQSLPRLPIEATFQITDLQKALKSELKNITTPTILIHAKKDLVAPYSNMQLLKKLLGSPIVETATFNRSRHVITLDLEKELAANAVVQFFRRFP